MQYKRIIDFREKLKEMCEGIRDIKRLEQIYSIDTFFEAEVYKTYEIFAKFCKEKGYKRVFDIGSGFGFQSEIFLNKDIDYVGINDCNLDFWNKDKFKYIINTYPFKIETKEKDIAISSYCLTWNCYLWEKEKTLKKQCEALARDFNYCLLYAQKDKIEFVKKYFKECDILNKNIAYFSNK